MSRMLGKYHTKETKEKMKLSHLGKKYKLMSEEGKNNIRLAHIGKKLSEMHKKNIGMAVKGRISPMKGKKHTEKSKIKMSLVNRGKRHHNWKGGKTLSNKRLNNRNWNEIRKQIYERDNWTCRICGKKCHNDIQCHHIIPYRITQDNSKSNLITLCISCHIKEEYKYYKKLKEQLEFDFV